MENRSWLRIGLVVLLSLVVLAAVGFFAYQFGFQHGAANALSQGAVPSNQQSPLMPFGRGFDGRGLGQGRMPRMGLGYFHFGWFRPGPVILGVLLLGLLVLAIALVGAAMRRKPAEAETPARRTRGAAK
jgi:uncharacterized membrane protein